MTAADLLAADSARSFRVAETRAAAVVPVGSLAQPSDALLSIFGGTPSRSGARVSEETALNVATVGACVNVLAQSIAMLPLKVYRKTALGAEEATDHPLSALLKRKPGPAQTSYQWRAWCQTCLGLGGNAYSRIYRNAAFEIERIEPIKPGAVQVLLASDGRLSYRINGVGTLADYEVLHLRGLSTNGYTGRSPIRDMRESVGLAMVAQDFASSGFRNGNRQPGLIKGPATWTRDKAQEFMSYWQSNYAGADNGGKTPGLFGGVEWVNAGFTNQDAELLLTRKFEVEEIARVYRVPLTLLQSMEKSTSFGTGIAELSRGFVTFTLTPWFVNWEHELEDKLLTEAEKAAGMFIKFTAAALLRGSPLEQAQKAVAERGARLITVNEYRAQLDLNEFPDTGANNPDWPLNAQEANQKSAPHQTDGNTRGAATVSPWQLSDSRSLPIPDQRRGREFAVADRSSNEIRSA